MIAPHPLARLKFGGVRAELLGTEGEGFKVAMMLKYRFPLRKSYWFHVKKVHYVDVGCWKLVKA